MYSFQSKQTNEISNGFYFQSMSNNKKLQNFFFFFLQQLLRTFNFTYLFIY